MKVVIFNPCQPSNPLTHGPHTQKKKLGQNLIKFEVEDGRPPKVDPL
jgi:hypothetical protein